MTVPSPSGVIRQQQLEVGDQTVHTYKWSFVTCCQAEHIKAICFGWMRALCKYTSLGLICRQIVPHQSTMVEFILVQINPSKEGNPCFRIWNRSSFKLIILANWRINWQQKASSIITINSIDTIIEGLTYFFFSRLAQMPLVIDCRREPSQRRAAVVLGQVYSKTSPTLHFHHPLTCTATPRAPHPREGKIHKKIK